MDGFIIGRAQKDCNTDRKNTELQLIREHSGIEIMMQTLNTGDLVMLTSDDTETWEFVLIIRGSLCLESENEQIVLGQNDSYSYEKLQKAVILRCLEDATLLYVTSKPTYQTVKVYVSNLDEMINKIDEKDRYTKLHCQHVMDYSIAISRKMKCNPSGIEKLAISALFHDVGKCCIPDEVLNKPSSLTADERRFIYKHPLESKILVQSNFGDEIAKIVMCHHERLDGSGYPQGLRGQDIPPEARIIAVADSFDAMTTKRPYNQPKSDMEAIEELLSMLYAYDSDAVYALRDLVLEGEIERLRKTEKGGS